MFETLLMSTKVGGISLSKLVARYFYSPICPEALKTLERLKKLFQNYDDIVFEDFNTAEDSLESEHPWFPEEMKVINTLEGKEGRPFFFGRLFIQGNEIKGFPPSPKSFREIFNKYDLDWNPDLYSFSYQSPARPRWDCNQDDFIFQEYNEQLSLDNCLICTRYHPYLAEDQYKKSVWENHEQKKLSFLNEKLKDDKLVGITAYYQAEPAGFIEAFPLDVAAQLGYQVSELVANRLMITCLSIRTEVSGYGLGPALIRRLIKAANKEGYKSLEVIAFPDENNWHPVSLYQSHGFKEVKKIGKLSLMRKSL